MAQKKQNGKNKNSGESKGALAALISVAAVAIVAVIVIVCIFAPKSCQGGAGDVQSIDTSESVEYIGNPDIGFYRPAFVKLTPEGGSATTPVYKDISLYHLRVDISAFSGAVNGGSDIGITDAARDKLTEVFEFYAQRERSVIIRLAYDPNYGGSANKEPALDTMLAHIDALSTVLNAHEYMLTAVEVGMVGPWGEMHTSAAANKTTINALIDRFLDKVVTAPVLVRTPRMIYDYLGITVKDIEGYTVPERAARLGMFNDGYLGSDSDLGTYSDRAKEVEFLSGVTERLPYGGEVTVPGSALHDIDKCVPEMFKLHLSYLNYEWNNEVVQTKWKNSTYTAECGEDSAYYGRSAFEYIRNRLGYRLLVTRSAFAQAGDNLDISLEISNVGFGNFNRKKNAAIVFVSEDGETHAVPAGEYCGESKFEASVPRPASGTYNVYIMLYSGELDAPVYTVAFANNGMFDATVKGNLIGSVNY